MLARSLGDQSRGILNGNPNTELQAWRGDRICSSGSRWPRGLPWVGDPQRLPGATSS